MLLQPVLGDRHKVGSIRCAEEITVGLHQANGIDPADSVKRFPKERGIPLYWPRLLRVELRIGRGGNSLPPSDRDLDQHPMCNENSLRFPWSSG
jgi:hypothetical protein